MFCCLSLLLFLSAYLLCPPCLSVLLSLLILPLFWSLSDLLSFLSGSLFLSGLLCSALFLNSLFLNSSFVAVVFIPSLSGFLRILGLLSTVLFRSASSDSDPSAADSKSCSDSNSTSSLVAVGL